MATPLNYAQQVLQDNPIAYWRLEDAFGATSIKPAVLGNTSGTIVSAPQIGLFPGPFVGSTSIKFNGTSDCIYFNNFEPTNGLKAMSMEVWYHGGYKSAWSAGFEIGAAMDNQGIYLALTNGRPIGSMRIDPTSAAGAGTQRTLTATNAIDTKNWHHLAQTWISDSHQLLYVDGVLVADSNTGYSGFMINCPTGFGLGALNAQVTPGTFFGGMIAHPAIYNYVLTPAQILAHYNWLLISPYPTLATPQPNPYRGTVSKSLVETDEEDGDMASETRQTQPPTFDGDDTQVFLSEQIPGDWEDQDWQE